MIVLKNSEKYSVFKLKNRKGETLILKISNRQTKFINREINYIKKLKKNWLFYKNKIPKISSHGVFSNGINKGKKYYHQKYIAGQTLTQLIHNKKNKSKKIEKLFKFFLKECIPQLRNETNVKKSNLLEDYKELFFKENKKLNNKNLISNLLKKKNLLINNKSYLNISYCLRTIFKSKKFLKIKQGEFFLSNNSHCNFHGGNIIFPNQNQKNFKIIDPDSSWKVNDPFFSLARLIYTFPHDTMEYDQYFLISKNFSKAAKNETISFNVRLNWTKSIEKKYDYIFRDFYFNLNSNYLRKLLTKEEYIRFNLTMILCFLRGINTNYEPKVTFLNNNSNHFLNKGIFLYLFFLPYLNNLTKYFNEK